MFPLFTGDDRKRRINLGGSSTVASHEEILQQAMANREERLMARRRQDAAIRLQAIWRGELSRRRTRLEFGRRFDENPGGIDAMRCLALMKGDENRLGVWSEVATGTDEVSLFQLAAGPQRDSWLVLVRQLAAMLLQSVANDPRSQYAISHLKVLNALLSPPAIECALPGAGLTLSQEILTYLLRHDYYKLVKAAATKIPPEAKTSPSLPVLCPLFTAPLTVFSNNPECYLDCFKQTLQSILTIPLLPNRLPLTSLPQFSARLPLHSFHLLAPISHDIALCLLPESKVHVLANLAAFMPPRYPKLSAPALDTYICFLCSLLAGVPGSVFEAPSTQTAASTVFQTSWTHEDDSEGEGLSSAGGPSSPSPFAEQRQSAPRIAVDAKTRTRVQSLVSPAHISALTAASTAHPATRLHFYTFLMALYTAWPASRDKILTTILAASGGALVRELYRGYVRSSPLGKSDDARALMDPAHAGAWPPLLFLTDLYTQSLLTMGDDEFFASKTSAQAGPSASATPVAHRNPLSIDELVAFSRQLMNIAFTLYWNESQPGVAEGEAPGTAIGWEGVRVKVTKLVQAIHARDSRRPFTPPNHWLFSSQLDMTSFVEAAVYEEQALSSDTPSVSVSRRGPARTLTKRQLAQISPRLGVLNNIPFAIPFETRVQIFRHFVVNDMVANAGGTERFERAHARERTRAVVRRDQVAADGFDKLGNANMKGLVEITFVDQFGQEEAGIDGGGVFKEFFTSLCKEVFDTDRGLWLATKQNELYPNPHSYAKEAHSLDWYQFIGRILGKALYEGILVDVAFAGFFLAKWLGKQSFLDDLASLDPVLYNGLLFLKNYSGDPEDLSLTFAVVEDDLGVAKTVDLIPNGSNISVTKENRLQYIYLICHYRLTKQIRPQSEAFFQGLSEMIDPKWIRMFNQQELQILIGGVNSPIDLDDLRSHTNYGGLYNDDEDTIRAFWRVVDNFDHEQRRALLRFATSCSRPPLLGFKELQPNFSIRDAGTDQHRLPTASTCVNLLKLPRYTNDNVLRQKLLQAITSGAGFDLS